ncbi:monooxygenase [Annulohypoxylon bovei var. microspora]|nr:monooxygenase [Annulohypoxylon bovei var. microspora]
MDSLRSIPLEGFGLFSQFFMYKLLAAGAFAFFGLTTAYFFNGFSPFEVFTRMSTLVLGFHTGLFSSMVIYRLFFHRLRKFPGPVDVKISRLLSAFRAAKKIQYQKELVKMHNEYGDFIRTGPREVCIVRRSAPQLIFGPNSKCLKSTFYGQVDYDSRKNHIVGATDIEDHRRRRRAWDKGISIKALQTYEPRAKALVDKFVSQIARQRGPVDARDWSMYLAFDIIGEVGFGKDFGCVETGKNHPAIMAIHSHMSYVGVLAHVPWLLNMFSRIPGASKGFHPFYQYVYNQIKAVRKNFVLDKTPQNIMTWLFKAVAEKDISASPTEQSLTEDCRALIIAGSDTNGITLANTLWFLCKYPSVLKKLQAQIDATIPTPADWTDEKVRSITFINNIIDEVLRLKPAVLVGGFRVTPREGLQVDEQFIPGHTNVFVPTQIIQTDPRYWKQASEFIPERWGERYEEMGTSGAPYMPFSLGPYICAGKNLAMMSLRIMIAGIAQNFDLSFAPGETGETFDKEPKETFTTGLSSLMVNFTLRK